MRQEGDSPDIRQFRQLADAYVQQRQAEAAQRETQLRQAELQARQQQQEEQQRIATGIERLKARRAEEIAIGIRMRQELEQEVKGEQMDMYAIIIRERLWRNPYVPIEITEMSVSDVRIKGGLLHSDKEYQDLNAALSKEQLDLNHKSRAVLGEQQSHPFARRFRLPSYVNREQQIAQYENQQEENSELQRYLKGEQEESYRTPIQAQEQIINRSKVGRTLAFTYNTTHRYVSVETSYTDEGSEPYTIVKRYEWIAPTTESLSFGIGYFGDRKNILQAAQETVKDEDLIRGTKAYFIQWKHFDPGSSTLIADTYVFPFSFPGSKGIFLENLFSVATRGDPNIHASGNQR